MAKGSRMNCKKVKGYFLFGICLVLLLQSFALPLGAEWRTYQANKALSGLVEQFLEQMAAKKVKFSIQKIFNERTEGHQGFILQLIPKGSLCKIVFHQKVDTKNYVVMRVFTQNYNDSQLIHTIVAQQLQMNEVGIYDFKKDKKNKDDMHWPNPFQ